MTTEEYVNKKLKELKEKNPKKYEKDSKKAKPIIYKKS